MSMSEMAPCSTALPKTADTFDWASPQRAQRTQRRIEKSRKQRSELGRIADGHKFSVDFSRCNFSVIPVPSVVKRLLCPLW